MEVYIYQHINQRIVHTVVERVEVLLHTLLLRFSSSSAPIELSEHVEKGNSS